MINIAIFGTLHKNVAVYTEYLFAELLKYQAKISIYTPFAEILKDLNIQIPEGIQYFNNHSEIDLNTSVLISIGGDGTFLESITLIRNKNIPIVGINTGRLGFLANISKDEIALAIKNIMNKNYKLEKRSLIKLTAPHIEKIEFPFALNEISIHKKDSTMITIHIKINGEYLNSYWTDGVIIATPTGSTAYSLSVGGPIVTPDSNVLIVSPIAPHSLTIRPLVIPSHAELTLKVDSRNDEYLITIDSKSFVAKSNQEFTISLSDFHIDFIQFQDTNFYNTLRTKLMWGVDKRN